MLQSYRFPGGMYTGGLLVHNNSHLYAVYSNRLFVFWHGDLTNHTWKELPTTLNSGMVQTNGLLVSQDGLLVIKQWSWTIEEFLMVSLAEPLIPRAMITIFVITFTVICCCLFSPSQRSMHSHTTLGEEITKEKTMRWISYLRQVCLSMFFAALISILLVNAFVFAGQVRAVQKPWSTQNPLRYVLDGVLSPNRGGGELKLVDPWTLNVVAEIALPERCSFARMALSPVIVPSTVPGSNESESEDVIVLLGEESVHQIRWSPKHQKLYWILEWSRRYRRRWQGSFPGTGPSIYQERVFFTDNTFPVRLGQGSYSMFSMDLSRIQRVDETTTKADEELVSRKHYIDSAQTCKMFPPSSTFTHVFTSQISSIMNAFPNVHSGEKVSLVLKDRVTGTDGGFMFWSVTIMPEISSPSTSRAVGLALVWDSAGRTVQARDIQNIQRVHWMKENIIQADCLTALPNKGHIYMTDYDMGPLLTNEWLGATTGKIERYREGSQKYFLVVNAVTGEELVRKSMEPYARGINPSLLVPGANNDVFLGSQKGIIRVYT